MDYSQKLMVATSAMAEKKAVEREAIALIKTHGYCCFN